MKGSLLLFPESAKCVENHHEFMSAFVVCSWGVVIVCRFASSLIFYINIINK
jgi:hypothetical protein